MKKLLLTVCMLFTLVCAFTAQANALEAQEAELLLPAALTEIEEEAFRGIKAKSVYLQDKVTTIGAKAFADCEELLEIRIPASVTDIAADAFEGHRSDLTICGAADSQAHKFAVKYKITFVPEGSGDISIPIVGGTARSSQ